MRNVHLGLGLGCIAMALMFALSSLFVVFRTSFPDEVTETDRTVQVDTAAAETPRAVALELIRNHGVKGDVLGIEQDDTSVRFRVHRPGTEHRVEYTKGSGTVQIQDRRWQLGQTLLQIHTTHGFWHNSVPQQIWALLSLLCSIGLVLLGGSGVYLWFEHHEERIVGTVLFTVGLSYGLITLVLTRLDS